MAPEKEFILVTTVGTDRPGIVEDISGWIFEAEGNIEDSCMSLLGGEFATIVLVSGENGLLSSLEKTLKEFQKNKEFTIFLKAVSENPQTQEKPVLRYLLHATSLDHPGIVHKVSQLLSSKGINIILAQTQTVSAPFSGAPSFHLEMQIDIPASVSINTVREELKDLGDSKNIDFTLSAEESNL
jgi:glycine cleavage system transcriptional repressor